MLTRLNVRCKVLGTNMVQIPSNVYRARCTRSGPVLPMAARGLLRAPLPWRPSGLPARTRLRRLAYVRSRPPQDVNALTAGSPSGHERDDADRERSLARRPRLRMVARLPDRLRPLL